MAHYLHDPGPVFAALSDPCRRVVVMKLAESGEMAVTALAHDHRMALPTFLKHIKVLESANIIRTRKSGRTRFCSLSPNGLRAAQHFLKTLEAGWEARLDRLESRIKESDP